MPPAPFMPPAPRGVLMPPAPGPLFRGLYLYRKLGQVHELRAHLRSLRKQHALVDLRAPPLRRGEDAAAAVRAYLEKVLGFYVLDQSMCALSGGEFV